MKILNDSHSVIRIPKELKDTIKKYSLMLKISQSKFIRNAIIKEIDNLKEYDTMMDF